MSDIKNWSSTAASNNSAAPDGFPEGMNPSDVNNASREVMAAIRRWYVDAEWIDLGDTPTFATSTTFTISGDVTATYESGRRIRCTDASTLYGEISSSSYSAPNTTVTVTLDSGSLSASLSAVALGIIGGSDSALPGDVVNKTSSIFNGGAGIVVIRGDTNDDADNRYISIQQLGGAQRARIGHIGSDVLIFNNDVPGGFIRIQGVNTAGTLSKVMLDCDPDGTMKQHYDGSEVTQTAAASSGGLLANNTSTGSGFERVLTVGDLLTDAEIKTAYENNADTNAFTDAEQTKLDNIEHGRVNSAGTSIRLPSGWTSSRVSAGRFRVTHNLATTSYSVVAVPASSTIGLTARVPNTDKASNSFDVYMSVFNGVTAAHDATDSDFSFSLQED